MPVKSKVKISQNCVAFSEYMNFKKTIYICCQELFGFQMDKFKAILIVNLFSDPQVSREMFEIIVSSNSKALFGAQKLIFGCIIDIVNHFALID